MEILGDRAAMLDPEQPDMRGASTGFGRGAVSDDGAACAMKPTGETDKHDAGASAPSDKKETDTSDRAEGAESAARPVEPDQEPQRRPPPPSESDRAAAARTNPLRAPAEDDRPAERRDPPGATGDDAPRGASPRRESDGDPAPGAGPTPELRIPASVLSSLQIVEPSAEQSAERGAEPRHGYTGRRRRSPTLPAPKPKSPISILPYLWPTGSTRKGSRLKSRYGLVAFTIVLLYALNVIRTELLGSEFGVAENWQAFAATAGTVFGLIVLWIGYFFHSRIAALLVLSGFVGLIVFQYRTDGSISGLSLAVEAVLLYMLLHGVHGTIAYHIYGRRKRRKAQRYRYRGD